MTKRLAGLGEALVASAGVALGVASVLWAAPGDRVVATIVGVGLSLGSASVAAAGSLRRSGSLADELSATEEDPVTAAGPDPAPVWTTVVRRGDEPEAVVRSTVELARRAGPVVVVGEPIDDGPTVATIADALSSVTTGAVLLVSGRAVPDPDACAVAVRRMVAAGAAWVVGRADPIGGAALADRRRVVGERLRAALRRRGRWTWEPDAVVVATALVRAHPLPVGRPWGCWLRERATEGHSGVGAELVLARRAEPAGGPAHWAYAMARRRATVADLSAAGRRLRTGDAADHGRGRWVARLLVVREIDAVAILAVSVGWWSTILSGRAPWGRATVPLVLAAAGVGTLRYLLVHRAVGLAPQPLADLRSAVGGLPDSLAAVVAVVRRRPLAVRPPAPSRPLIWAALVLTAVTGSGLVNHTAGATPSATAVLPAVLTLAALWVVAVRALVERSFQRLAFRVALDAAVEVGGWSGRTLDASVGGLSARLEPPADGTTGTLPEVGSVVPVRVAVAPDVWWDASARVVARRRRGGAPVVGLALEGDGSVDRDPWRDRLLAAVVGTDGSVGRASVPVRHAGALEAAPRRRWSDVGLAVGGLAVSALVLTSLVLVLAGYQPLVVRSGSMVPTLGVGDVTIDEPVRADSVRPGQIVTRPASATWPERLTHRVLSVRRVGGGVEVTTRGDANDFSEVWVVPADEVVGRTVTWVPKVGAPALLLRTPTGRGVAAAVAAVGLAATFRRRRSTAVSSSPASVAW